MQREIATEVDDLPHVPHKGRAGGDNCYCGRTVNDPLHSERARELARDFDPAPVLQTEKGV
jgi:hypothetical protein